MPDEVDLDEGLLLGHGRELDLLHTHDLVSGKLVHEAIEVELALGAFALNMVGDLVGGADLLVDDAGLVLAQLTRDLGGGDVDGRVHVLFALFDADDIGLSRAR